MGGDLNWDSKTLDRKDWKVSDFMNDLVLMVPPTDSKDGAAEALDVAKKLDHEDWIKLIDYSLFKKDEKGHVSVRRMSDEFSEKVAAAAVGITGGVVGGVIGALWGPPQE